MAKSIIGIYFGPLSILVCPMKKNEPINVEIGNCKVEVEYTIYDDGIIIIEMIQPYHNLSIVAFESKTDNANVEFNQKTHRFIANKIREVMVWIDKVRLYPVQYSAINSLYQEQEEMEYEAFASAELVAEPEIEAYQAQMENRLRTFYQQLYPAQFSHISIDHIKDNIMIPQYLLNQILKLEI